MEQATTGIKITQQSTKEILQYLSNGGMCVIPTAFLRTMLDENMKLLAKSIEISQYIAKSLDVIMKNASISDTATETSTADILSRLDNLTSAISSSTSALKGEADVQCMRNDLKVRSTLIQKKLHSEKICQLYDELLSDEIPYAPSKLRARVSATAKESEKKHRRDFTIFNVQTQIKIMRDNIKDWEERISIIDGKRDSFLTTHSDHQESITKRIQRDEEKAAKSVNHAISKLRHSYEEDKRTLPEGDFLISTLNQRDSTYKRTRNRGRKSWRRGRQNYPP